MSVAGGWRVLQSCVVVVMLIISVLQIWVCCDCKAGAVRTFPQPAANINGISKKQSDEDESNMVTLKEGKKSKEALLHNYFNGRSAASNFNKTQKGFKESKRTVPSCPDPLHN